MSEDTTVRASGGIGLFGLTFVVLLVLKLTNLAQITWFWVFFPLWILPAILLGVGGIFFLVYAFLKLLDFMPGRRYK